MKPKLFATIPESCTKGEDRVRITSHFSTTKVYVARLIKTTNCWSKRRYLIDKVAIRIEQPPVTATV